ncbi:hypothetical protein CPB83DRAFT_538068 [Crepidotus variabilis]|uniref:Uncharacterized protein n=1 Tax=Crepidotus variabilis TaxID=179855 RepID=A0A9P6EQS2_9AGAR|nr:hypothetical protein CPB83DRAFT_538068 [Crepidotus variabilis]
MWPAPADIDMIVEKSSGQFIFAATLVQYVGSLRHKPHERLQAALNWSERYASQLGESPFKELDALYLHIFSGVENVVLVLSILDVLFNSSGAKTRCWLSPS